MVYLSSIDHITDKFYEESGMLSGRFNIKEYRANSLRDDKRRARYIDDNIINKAMLDFGCGGGGLLHLLKERTSRIAGLELDKTLHKMINDEGITCYQELGDIKEKFDYITMFHVIEHLPNPIQVLVELRKYLVPNGKIIIEVPNSEDALLTLYKNEAFANFTYWSCHLFLFNASTLQELFKQAGYRVNYIKQVQRYPLSNHLYWQSNQLPGGHKEWNFLNNSVLDKEYESQLAAIGKCDTLLAEISL
ncbi:class I SAM-dependent methyltransferase [Sporosarcina highlanderae]|uniref:Class I SAM-dependent methyltransferase n=1 Tax=Sporosarcina highlanderae TaxID=3035916 RepID=A0ABT8JNT2_9BACL|nr:class I SAM-dependent methyltransferase [Sporosarcina highlanderae]MDN4606801.1 class I SAM-dependent methyltransferase [Sporosarcina highlanderae]